MKRASFFAAFTTFEIFLFFLCWNIQLSKIKKREQKGGPRRPVVLNEKTHFLCYFYLVWNIIFFCLKNIQLSKLKRKQKARTAFGVLLLLFAIFFAAFTCFQLSKIKKGRNSPRRPVVLNEKSYFLSCFLCLRIQCGWSTSYHLSTSHNVHPFKYT